MQSIRGGNHSRVQPAQPTTLFRSQRISEENSTNSSPAIDKISSLSVHIGITGSVSRIESINSISSTNTSSLIDIITATTIVSDDEDNSHETNEVVERDENEEEKEEEMEGMYVRSVSSVQSVPQTRGIASSKSELILFNWEHSFTIRSDNTSQDISSSIYDCSWPSNPREETNVRASSVLENSVGPLQLASFDADGLVDSHVFHTGNCRGLPTTSEYVRSVFGDVIGHREGELPMNEQISSHQSSQSGKA